MAYHRALYICIDVCIVLLELYVSIKVLLFLFAHFFRGHFSLHDALIRHASVDPTIRDDMGNLSSDYCAEFPAANMNATTIGSTTLTEAKRTYK